MGDKMLTPGECHEKLFENLQRFHPFSRESFDKVVPFLEIRRCEKKIVLLDKGEVDNCLHMVVRGIVRKFVPQSRKGEVTLQLATENHFVQSEISFHHRKPSEVVLETLEATTLVSINYDSLKNAFDTIPEMEQMGEAIIMHMFSAKDARYFEQLNKTTRERFIAYMTNHPHMLQRVPQKILASYLDIKPETFSRLKHLLVPKR